MLDRVNKIRGEIPVTAPRCAEMLRANKAKLAKSLIAGYSVPRDNRFDDPPDVFEARVAERTF